MSSPDKFRRKAPWTDYAGNEIFEGDTIRHPSGETGRVVYERLCKIDDFDNWRVDYGDGFLSRLGLQIGNRGQAVVVETGKNKTK